MEQINIELSGGRSYKVDLWDRNTPADGLSLSNRTLKPMCKAIQEIAKDTGGSNDYKKLQTKVDIGLQETGKNPFPITFVKQNENGNLDLTIDRDNEIALKKDLEDLGNLNSVSANQDMFNGDGTSANPLKINVTGDVNAQYGWNPNTRQWEIAHGAPCASAWKPSVDENGWLSWELSEDASEPGGYQIPAGERGANGLNAVMSADPILDTGERIGTKVWFGYYDQDEDDAYKVSAFDVLNGEKGADGVSGTSISAYHTDENTYKHIVLFDPYNDPSHEHPIDEFNVSNGTNGISGTSISARSSKSGKKTTVELFNPYSNPEHVIDTLEILDGNDGQTTGALDIFGNNGISAAKESDRYVVGLSAEYQPKGDYVTSAVASFPNNGIYGLQKTGQVYNWAGITIPETPKFDNTQSYHTLSGDGSTNNPIGVNTDVFYKKIETSAASELNTEFGKYLKDVEISDEKGWGNVPYLSGDGKNDPIGISNQYTNSWNYKSHVEINTTNNEIKVGEGQNTSAVSAVIYKANPSDSYLKAQRLYIALSDNDIINIVNGGGCEGQGTLFFRLENANT